MTGLHPLLNSQPVDLTSLNTFGVSASADALLQLTQIEQLDDFFELKQRHPNILVLGGGSNLLFVEHFKGLVAYVALKGVEYHDEHDDSICVTAMAGENWHELVMGTLKDGYSGLENLALIPGTVGAAPIQNIGAYGVELEQRLVSVKAFSLEDGHLYTFERKECEFGYRDSLFKRQLGRFLVVSVTLKLDKQLKPVLNYSPLNSLFADKAPSAYDIAQAVISTRQSKLPDPQVLGNAGSFFKNPLVSQRKFMELQKEFPGIVGFPNDEGQVKLAAGWLIDNLGLKGYRMGDAGVHRHQALVLVNYGTASGRELFDLSHLIQSKVQEAYGVLLEREVRVIGASE